MNKHNSVLKVGALVLGILIIIGGIYVLIWGIVPAEGDDEGDTFAQEGGCFIALGLVIITTGGLFVTYFLHTRQASPGKGPSDTEMKVCSFCNKRVESDQELCYHCGHEFK